MMSGLILSSKTRFLVLLGAAAFTLAACAAPAEQAVTEETPETEQTAEAVSEVAAPAYLASAGEIKYCATLDNPPRGSLDEGFRPVGFEVELGKEMAALMDLRVEWVQLKFDGIIAALQANQCDVIVQELFIREARLEIIDMIPFSNTGQRLVAVRGAEITGDTLADLGGATVAVPNGTSIAGLIEEANAALAAVGGELIDVQVLPTTTDTFAALDAGTVDVVGTTTTAAAYYVGLNPDNFEFLGAAFGLIETGFGINKDNPELTAAIKEAFNILVENGTYDRLIAEFNMEGSEL
jgi:polar amino acid transport system substrate-binding protein